MANEKQLIYREDLLVKYDRVHIGPPGGARKLMEDAPAVDAVVVVRCKDCFYFTADAYCGFWGGCRHPEHYCGEGLLDG